MALAQEASSNLCDRMEIGKRTYDNIETKFKSVLLAQSSKTESNAYLYLNSLMSIYKLLCDATQFFKEIEEIKVP